MPLILIDSVDKRMTIPLVNALVKQGFEVHGIHFKGSRLLSNQLKVCYAISRETSQQDLREIYSKYSEEDYLIIGNPKVIQATQLLKPVLKHLLPPQELIHQVENKKWLMAFASNLNIKVPREENLGFPRVIKLNNSENTTLTAKDRYRIVGSPEEYEKALDSFPVSADKLIIQEYIPGKGIGVSVLMNDHSELLDYIIHQRDLEYPVVGGPSAFCRTIADAVKLDQAVTLLKALNWKGIAMVEFKGDTLMEINPRFWGSMPLIFCSGSSFFHSYLQLLDVPTTRKKDSEIPYLVNKKMYYCPQVCLGILQLIKMKQFKQAGTIVLNCLLAKEGIWRFSNPKPFFLYISTLFRREKK